MHVLDLKNSRLTEEELQKNFSDAHPPLTHEQALVEAERCFYCYDAPCTEACPTSIDIPKFIHAIATGNMQGSAHTILESNILGDHVHVFARLKFYVNRSVFIMFGKKESLFVLVLCNAMQQIGKWNMVVNRLSVNL